MQSLYQNACAYQDTKDRNRKPVTGTCKWFTNHDLFKQWNSGTSKRDRRLLYVTADPGCGKSVLSRYLIDEVLPAAGRLVCYFFFKDDFEEQKSSLRAVCTILYQLFEARSSLLTHAILDAYDKQRDKFFDSFANLWSVFVVTTAQQNVMCIFDALDECREEDMKQLIEAITSVRNTQPSKVGTGGLRCLLTSRPYDHIRRRIQHTLNFEMTSIHLQGDQGAASEELVDEIKLVVDSRINETAEYLGLNSDERVFMQTKLESIPNRTYLWITLIFDGLLQTKIGFNKATVLGMLQRPPLTVDEAYEKILDRDVETGAERRRALHTILAARRPLSLAEMSVALAFQNASSAQGDVSNFIIPQSRFREHLRDLCGLFITVVDEKVYLLHQTAREFLLCSGSRQDEALQRDVQRGTHNRRRYAWKHSMSEATSNSILTNTCIRYLLSDSTHEHALFLSYSGVYWTYHYQQSHAQTRIELAQSARDLCSLQRVRQPWLHIYSGHHGIDHPMPKHGENLCLAAFFGLDKAVRLLLDERHQTGARHRARPVKEIGAVGKVLSKATPKCLSRILYRSGLRNHISNDWKYINMKDRRYYRTPLCWAASEGHEAVVKLLRQGLVS
jgi:hypothetical protein